MKSENVLEVKGLETYFHTPSGEVKAVDDISFDLRKGEVFGLVGESGSGKTLTALSILRLIAPPGEIVSGNIIFNGTDIMRMGDDTLLKIRGSKISIVFQEPASAFNPVFTVGYQIAESVMVHQRLGKPEAAYAALKFLRRVHITDPERVYHSYPHQLSGGTKQRAMIAMALVNSPELLILDEPTTALDVTIQAQILDLLKELIDRNKMSVLFISHDFGVIAKMCDRVGVMYKGKMVETSGIEAILNSPKDPYTISLIESVKALS
ncbi:MAG: ABC transporter ATP-binding protein [Candidatus Omnitrophica bacterium]|nr:ABC transporter ATP-binding protein [Candidatus Omnitrophota bacterium]